MLLYSVTCCRGIAVLDGHTSHTLIRPPATFSLLMEEGRSLLAQTQGGHCRGLALGINISPDQGFLFVPGKSVFRDVAGFHLGGEEHEEAFQKQPAAINADEEGDAQQFER